jgi:hypothetical protein
MDPRLNIIIQNFDLRKLDRTCNDRNCQKPPSKKTTVFELNQTNMEKKELVVLNLCTEHFTGLKRFLRELAELTERDKAIGVDVLETGYITH